MRTDIERLGLRMAAEIDGQQWGARLAAKQEGDGRSAGRVALERFGDGAAERGGSILVQQLHQVRGLMPGRFPAPDQVLQRLPNIVRGSYNLQALTSLISWSLGGSVVTALLGLLSFARRDV